MEEREIALDVQDLVKTYGGRRVVDGLSFQVFQGEIQSESEFSLHSFYSLSFLCEKSSGITSFYVIIRLP